MNPRHREWITRQNASGAILSPSDLPPRARLLTRNPFDDLDADLVEVVIEGPLRVLPITGSSAEWIRENTSYHSEAVWDVAPVGWTPKCPRTGEELAVCWLFSPTGFYRES